MSQPLSLLMQTIGVIMPEDMIQILHAADEAGIDLRTPIQLALRPYGRSLEDMVRMNLSFDGWWGLPGPISTHTYNREE